MHTITLSFLLPTTAHPKKIWQYYTDFVLRKLWETDLEQFTLLGELKSGAKAIFKLQNMPAMDVILSTVIIDQEFTEQFMLENMGILSFSHQIEKISSEQWAIKALISLAPNVGVPEKECHLFLKEISSDIMDKAFALKTLVEG